MSSVSLIIVGLLVVYMGVTDTLGDFWDTLTGSKIPAGYPKISLGKFLLGAVIVSIPLGVLENQGEGKWAGPYIVLIATSLLVVNYSGIEKFTGYLKKAGL